MLVLLLIISLVQSCGVALAIVSNNINGREELPITVQNHKMRTTLEIVWSCVSTLFICTWVAIHPNIPPREGPIWSLWRRIKLMLWTLLVPELVLIWAYRQWAAARFIAEYFKDQNWTPMHGHFLIMGGFVYVNGGDERVLDFDDFRHLLGLEIMHRRGYPIRRRLSGWISFPTITGEEICDKARGDFLSKAIVILQSLWFIVQCIARGKEGLALTELELVTLALASLTGIMYFFWWDKPLGVKEPIKIYCEDQVPPKKVIEGGQSEDEQRRQWIRDSSKRSLVQKLVVCPLRQLQSSLSKLLFHSHTSLSSCYARFSSSNINQILKDQRSKLHRRIPAIDYLWPFYLPLYWFIWIPFISLLDAVSAIVVSDELQLQSSRVRVPTFYAPRLSASPSDGNDISNLLFFVLAPIAVVFGSLHCIAWNFHFPSRIEQLLWRIGSLAITLIPSVPTLLFIIALAPMKLAETLQKHHISLPSMSLPRSVERMLVVTLGFLGGLGLVAYMLARLLLLTQAIILLRKQPESAFYAISWVNFFPHI